MPAGAGQLVETREVNVGAEAKDAALTGERGTLL